MHQVVTAQLAARRAGTQSTRPGPRWPAAAPSRGGRRAPAGPARARTGRRSGAAVASPSGPKPRSYAQRTPKKMVRLALLLGAVRPRRRRQGRRARRVGLRRAQDEGRRRRARRARDRRQGAARARRGRTRRVWQSFRNLGDVHCLFARELNAYDVLVATASCSPARRCRAQEPSTRRRRTRRVVARHAARGRGRRTEAQTTMKDPRDVIIEPVVSREVVRAARAQRLHVPRPPRRVEAGDPRRRRGDLQRARR